jgi:hypothetical protein
MRSIKFRGLRKNHPSWVYGNLHYLQADNFVLKDYDFHGKLVETTKGPLNRAWIMVPLLPESSGWDFSDTFQLVEVLPESVGQFTGKQDINGTDIYDGDLIRLSSDSKSAYKVYWRSDSCDWHLIHSEGDGDKYGPYSRNFGIKEYKEVIGSIHTHPELLKQKV